MREGLCLLIYLFSVCWGAHAQTTEARARLTATSVIKDSSGIIYSTSTWKRLLSTGDYILEPVDAKSGRSSFLIRKLTATEKMTQARNAPKPAESKFFTTGKSISGFSVFDIRGNKYSLEDLKGKVVVINFWFVNCSPCRREMPELNQLVNDFTDSSGSVVFLAIALDEKHALNEFLDKNRFDYNVVDSGRSIAHQYGISIYPTHLVLNKEGKVIYHSSGYSEATVNWLRRSIGQALSRSR
jgi:peroxiredoxin